MLSHSWADRVKTEVGSAVVWEQEWSGLYRPSEPIGYAKRIADLEAKLKT